MKKLILKTAFITVGILLILAISVFGLTSLWAPAAMMDFTASLGLTSISGDYAYQEYERSGSLSCLSRAFLTAADAGHYGTAEKRFTLLYEDETFDAFCTAQDSLNPVEGTEVTYKSYLCAQAARVKYRLSKTEEEDLAVCTFAFAETAQNFPTANPVIMLAVEAAGREDTEFCVLLLDELEKQSFEQNEDYHNIVKILRGNANE